MVNYESRRQKISEADEPALLYHGSAVANLTKLLPLSKLHGTNEPVAYLSSNIPYCLLYIWDAEKTQCSQKWVTGWVKDGIAYYEEQFPGQLKAFYDGVKGYIYRVPQSENMVTMPQRESMFYSKEPVDIYSAMEISNVYQELIRYERQGQFKILRFEDATAEKQAELTSRIANYIQNEHLPAKDNEMSRFMAKYFTLAWEKAAHNPQTPV